MKLVRLILVFCTVIAVAAFLVGQPAHTSRPDDDLAVVHNWSVPFHALHSTSSDALFPDSNVLASTATHFIEMAPCRVYDSRIVAGGPGPISGATARTIHITSGPCAGIASNAAGFSLNFTVTGSVATGSYAFITAYPTGITRPNASSVNFQSGAQVGNAAIVQAGTNGDIDVYASATTEVIVDINGYFVPGVVTNLTAGSGLTGGGTGSVSLGIATGGVSLAHLSAAGSSAGQVLTSGGGSVYWGSSAGGATGATGPQGPAGPTGATGPQGPTGASGSGIGSTAAFSGMSNTIYVSSSWQFLGSTATVTTSGTTPRVTATASAALGLASGSAQDMNFSLCYQSSGGGTIYDLTGGDYAIVKITTTRFMYSYSASKVLTVGTWNVGPCVTNMGPSNISNNDYFSGWVQVTN